MEDEEIKMNRSVCFHKWKFETPIYRNNTSLQEPHNNVNSNPVLDWVIVDINDYLKDRYETNNEEPDDGI